MSHLILLIAIPMLPNNSTDSETPVIVTITTTIDIFISSVCRSSSAESDFSALPRLQFLLFQADC